VIERLKLPLRTVAATKQTQALRRHRTIPSAGGTQFLAELGENEERTWQALRGIKQMFKNA